MRWWGLCLGVLAAWPAVAEVLGPDGFPTEWTAEDFRPLEVPVSSTASPAVSPTSAPKKGMLSVPVSALPTVKPDSSTTPMLTSSSISVSLSAPARNPALPVVEEDNIGAPEDMGALDSWGPLTELSGGVEEDAWEGVPRAEALAMVGSLQPVSPPSPALQGAVSRLLLTRAPVAGDPSATQGSWLATRAKALQGMGLDEQAYALWRAVPPLARNADSELARGWALSSLLAGKSAEPCALARKVVVESPVAPWRDMAVVCTALDRVGGGIEFGLAVADEQGGLDLTVRKLLVALRDDEAPVKLAKGDTIGPLSAAILATYPALLEADALPKMPGVVLRRLVQTQGLPLAMRAMAAEILLQRGPGLTAAENLRVLYEAFTFPPDQVVAAPVVAKDVGGTHARALLWQAARQAPQNTDKARAWHMFAARAAADGLGHIGRWLGPGRAGVEARADVAEVAADATISAWLQDDITAARAWRVAAAEAPSATVNLIKRRARTEVQAAVVEGRLRNTDFEQWLVTEGIGDAAGRYAAVRTLSILDGLDVTLPDDAWQRLDEVMALRNDALGGDVVRVEALRTVAKAKQTGPVVARLVAWVQERPPTEWAPLEAKAAVEALMAVGLKQEARLLAWELMRAPVAKDIVPPEREAPAAEAVSTTRPTAVQGGVRIQNMGASEKR